MIKYESECVSCGLPCLGGGCPYYSVPVYYCDECGERDAEYTIDEQDLCEDCAKKYLIHEFENMDVSEMAELLDISLETRY